VTRRGHLLRRVVAFAGIACLSLAVVILRASRTTTGATTFPATFEAFDSAAVASVRIARTTKRDGKEVPGEVVLQRTGASSWVVANRGGYPAKTADVSEFLEKVREARTKTENTRDPSKAKAFAGEDGWTEVTVRGQGDATLARFGIGKSGAGGSYENTYLRLGEPPPAAGEAPAPALPTAPTPAGDFRVVTATGIDAYVRADPEEWVDRDLWPSVTGSDVVEIEIDQREKGRTVHLVREEKKAAATEPKKEGEGAETPPPEGGEDRWTMRKPTEGPAAPSVANATAAAIANLSLESLVVAKEGAGDADYGFDKPQLVLTARGRLLAGAESAPAYVVTVGKKVEGKETSYARRGSDPFVFEISEVSLREFRNEPESWAEKKPDESKPAETPPGEEKPEEAKPAEEKPPGEPKEGEGPGEEKPSEGTGEGGMGSEAPPPGAGEGPAPPAMGEEPPK
jgi:hypothetical protein